MVQSEPGKPAGRRANDEQTPLLSDGRREGEAISESHIETGGSGDDQKTRSTWYLVLLTISIGGLQIAWSVELSNGSPYLLSLGLSKSIMALVWIAGPLTGTLVQPYVGMLSDTCRIPWGKRKPFMLGGAAATVASLMFLSWTKEIVSGIAKVLGADPTSEGVKVAIMATAVLGIYVLDFAINTVQAAIRAFIVDCAPAHQQEAANAMASRITGLGNIVGYVAGYVELPKYLWFLGDTQFKILCALASIALASTVVLSTAVIRERDPRLDGPPPQSKPSVFSFFFTISKSIQRLPPQIRRVCQVQFCAWIGFFPLLFYTSSYIGEIYVEPYLEANPHMTPAELDRLYERATRVGTFALLINSVVSLLTNVFLPFFIAPTYDSQPIVAGVPGETDAVTGHGAEDSDADQPSILDYLRIPGFTLKRAWLGALLLFSGAMFCTVLVRTITAATVLIGLVGITWAMTLWAPWAIISAEISRRDAARRAQKMRSPSLRAQGGGAGPAEEDETEEDQAGVILGIHNMAIAAPQIIATVGSSIIFKIWQKPRGTPGDRSISVVLALGGFFVLLSCYFVLQIQEESTEPPESIAEAEEQQQQQQPQMAEDLDGQAAASRRSARRPPVLHKRMSSFQQSRRATMVRNKSFGGAEMY
jgi:solute carrier family 45 protein 1/2/4